jgi:hypothetical protein
VIPKALIATEDYLLAAA